MRSWAAILVPAMGCYHAQIAPALAARTRAVTPVFATDGTFTFFEYRVEQVVGPRVETWPHPVAAGLEEHGVRYRYTLRGPDGDLEVRCDVGKQSGSLFTDSYASIVCEMRGYTIVVSGYGDTDFLDLRRVDGSVHADASSAPKPDPRVPTYFSDRLRVEGSGKLWNLYRSREIHHLDHDDVWRSSCCEDVEPLAAVALRPPRILFDPALVAPLRLQAALAAAALLALRDQRELVGSDLMPRLRVQYAQASQLVNDYDGQMSKGGLLVRADAPAGLALFDAVELEIGAAFAPLDRAPVVVAGQVVQIIAGVGVAVVFDPAPLAAAVAAARTGPPPREGLPGVESPPREGLPGVESPPREGLPVEPPRGGGAETEPARAGAEKAAKIQQALHGNRDERARILRDTNRLLHPYVLRNPQLGLDEVLAIAKMSTMSPEILGQIAAEPDWAQRPDIAIALVRNPKTPTPAAVRLLDYVSAADIRQLAKDTRTRPAVQQAARKKLFGPG